MEALAVRGPERRRRASSARRHRGLSAIVLFAATAGGLGVSLSSKISAQLDSVQRVDGLAGVLTPLGVGPVENFLLVGSDSRAGADPNDPDFGGIGTDEGTGGQRSDTIMVMRLDRATSTASLLSLPRDLWVEIPALGKRNRINAAFSEGPDALVATVQQSLGIPLHHYLEVDFQGFKRLVDAIGGVDVCFLYAAKDDNTGLLIDEPGCRSLDGVAALQYARSRYYQEFRDGEWRIDGTADIGRMARQQGFIDTAVHQATTATAGNPFRVGGVLDAVVSSLRIDPSLDLPEVAGQLRTAAGAGLTTFALPVAPDEINGKSVLVMRNESALPLIAYFQGTGPVPAAIPS